jgi:hypothetical protein
MPLPPSCSNLQKRGKSRCRRRVWTCEEGEVVMLLVPPPSCSNLKKRGGSRDAAALGSEREVSAAACLDFKEGGEGVLAYLGVRAYPPILVISFPPPRGAHS